MRLLNTMCVCLFSITGVKMSPVSTVFTWTAKAIIRLRGCAGHTLFLRYSYKYSCEATHYLRIASSVKRYAPELGSDMKFDIHGKRAYSTVFCISMWFQNNNLEIVREVLSFRLNNQNKILVSWLFIKVNFSKINKTCSLYLTMVSNYVQQLLFQL